LSGLLLQAKFATDLKTLSNEMSHPAKPGPAGMIIYGEFPVCRQAGIWLKSNEK
jgi:hypothetical protein